jgi:hypothetical protein
MVVHCIFTRNWNAFLKYLLESLPVDQAFVRDKMKEREEVIHLSFMKSAI